MPRPKNPKLGRGPCPCCGVPLLFRSSPATGRISYTCDHCDHSAYADPGGLAFARWNAGIKKDDAPSSTPSSTPTSSPAPRPPSGGGFSLDRLSP